MNIKDTLNKLTNRQDLNESEITALIHAIMQGEVDPIQIAGCLVALRTKGESVTELATTTNVLRSLATTYPITRSPLLDIVGTGGDGSNTFNISTACSFVAAAAGANVAKHGSRSVSSKSGSSNVLTSAGINIELTPKQVAHCVDQLGIGFLYALTHHKSFNQVAPVRKALQIRTFFNILGPITNPANPQHILLGVYAKEWLEPIAKVLQTLGCQHAMVVHAEDGMDEFSIATSTSVVELHNQKISSYTVSPESVGLTSQSTDSLIVNSPEESLAIIQQVFDNQPGPAKDIVLLNAGAALYVANLAEDIASGVKLADDAINSGKAKQKFMDLIQLSNELSQ